MAKDKLLHHINAESHSLPEQLNNPFGYRIEGILKTAVLKLIDEKDRQWTADEQKGKTFGVLIVKTYDGTTGLLMAYSGLMRKKADTEGWVPPVYDITDKNGRFKKEEAEISELNKKIKSTYTSDYEKQSLKNERKSKSEKLQNWIFQQYIITNNKGEKRNINEIFETYGNGKHAPGGTGDCCAPKLLNYAYSHNMTPIAMAEIDDKGNAVPSCHSKCRPLLKYMLKGIKLMNKTEMPNRKNKNEYIETHPWGMFIPDDAEILMLGSFPPLRKRWSIVFYYPNFNNDMWRIMGLIYYNDKDFFTINSEKKFDKEKIITFLKEKKIALGDTAKKIIRHEGDSSDKNLEVIEAYNIRQIVSENKSIKHIVVTGEKASETLCLNLGIGAIKTGEMKIVNIDNRDINVWRMVSSSRAYPLSIEKKTAVYSKLFK